MHAPSPPQSPPFPTTVALIGNPNTGKTSLFNALTGFKRHVANYPGVTVEIARGPLRGAAAPIELIDLPGTYSLAALSPDEHVAIDLLSGRSRHAPAPDLVVVVADASNLTRNLLLLSQVLELGLPAILALNMMDLAQRRGVSIDAVQLASRLGIPVVPVIATQSRTLAPLIAAIQDAASGSGNFHFAPSAVQLPTALVAAADALLQSCNAAVAPIEARMALAEPAGDAEMRFVLLGGSLAQLLVERAQLQKAGIDAAAAEVRARYEWIGRMLSGVVTRPENPIATTSDKLDRVLTHHVWGGLILLAVLYLVFESIFRWAGPLMDSIDGAIGWVGGLVAAAMPEGALRSLLVDGVIGGVGGVLVFLPQIMILFGFIAVLEDCGYLARAAHMVDRLMRMLGLSGRAFIPLLSSFACAVPAIMGTRAIPDRRERFMTILLAPFMSCSARLPVYVLLIAAFVPAQRYLGGWLQLQALVLLAMYLVGVVVSIPLAWLMRSTVFRGGHGAFLMEMPGYKWPRLRSVAQRMLFAARKFLVSAGTVILLVNLCVWALGYFPHRPEVEAAVRATFAAAERTAGESTNAVTADPSNGLVEPGDEPLDQAIAEAYLRDSYLGRMGRFIEPAVRPLGWDWRVGMAVLASFPAREVVIGTLGTIYKLSEADDEEETQKRLAATLQAARWDGTDRPVFTLASALSLMVFFALCAQCSSTLVVIGREMGSWVWPAASFAMMTGLAYVAALATYQAATALAGG